MRKSIVLAVLMVALVGAGPTTKPANMSAGERYIAATEDREACAAALARAKESAVREVEGSPAYRDARAAVDAKLEQLKAARQSGSAEEKLSASAAYTKSRRQLDGIKIAYLKDDADIKSAQQRLEIALAAEIRAKDALGAELRRIIADSEERGRQEESEKMKDPIYAAMKQGRVCVGMTIEQLNGALSKSGSIMDSHSDEYLLGGKRIVVKTYTPGGPTISTAYKRIVVEDGVVTTVETFRPGDFVSQEVHF
jgi:hypothetical protein